MSAAEVKPLLAGLPVDYREKAFRAVETVLREDPVLDAVVLTWRSLEGHDDDLQVPAYDQMPMISLSTAPSPNVREAIDLTRIQFMLNVQLFVPGTCSQDITGLWGAVENAVVQSKPFRPGVAGEETVGAFLCSIFETGLNGGPRGVIRLWPSTPGFLAVDLLRQGNDPSFQTGTGTLSAFILRPA